MIPVPEIKWPKLPTLEVRTTHDYFLKADDKRKINNFIDNMVAKRGKKK